MSCFQIKLYHFLLISSFIVTTLSAQKRLAIIGSSTSACTGPSHPDSCYVNRIQRYYQSLGTPVTISNFAVGGASVYKGMPSSYTPPPERSGETPDQFHNITAALASNPDVILVNYPSNGYDIFSVAEVLFCLRTIKQTANNAGKPCYITTTQPRSSPSSFTTAETRRKMTEIRDGVLNEFASFAINFWDGIANPADGSAYSEYSAGDGVHLNNAGHRVLAQRVQERNMFNSSQPAGGNGLKFRYYEGDWNSLPDFNSLTPVKTGTSSNVDLSPRNSADFYGFVWEGFINIVTPGNYTFETISDDGSKFYFNSSYSAGAQALVNNDGLHPAQSVSATVNVSAPGAYPVAITYFEKNAGESMQLYWSGPGFGRQAVPNSAFMPPQEGSGLKYRYYEGDWNILPDFNALSPVKTGVTANVDMGPRNASDHYGFIWEGFIHIRTPGNYTFETLSDDGSKLYLNTPYGAGVPALVNNDGLHAARSATGTVTIPEAGFYPIAITFFEKGAGETMQVFYSGPDIARQPIPNSVLSQTPAPQENGLTYRYFEGNWDALPDFSSLSPLKTGKIANVDLSPRNVNDHYGFVWEGYINIPAAGNYTFETISDDGSKLYFNSFYSAGTPALVNNDGLHAQRSVSATVNVPSPGLYPVAVTFFDKIGGELLQIFWSGPGFGRQPVPNAAFSNTQAGNGIKYRYYEGSWNTLPDFNALTPVKSGTTPNIDLGPRNIPDDYGFVWEGYINIPRPGTYTFETVSDDGSKFYFNTMYNAAAPALVNNDGMHPARSLSGNVDIPAAGLYPFAVAFFERNGGETMQVFWSGPGFSRQLLPGSVLTPGAQPNVKNDLVFTPVPHQNAFFNANNSTIAERKNPGINYVFPNPFNDFINVGISTNSVSDVAIELYNLSGVKLHFFKYAKFPAGNNNAHIDLAKIPALNPGTYFITVRINGIASKTYTLIKIPN